MRRTGRSISRLPDLGERAIGWCYTQLRVTADLFGDAVTDQGSPRGRGAAFETVLGLLDGRQQGQGRVLSSKANPAREIAAAGPRRFGGPRGVPPAAGARPGDAEALAGLGCAVAEIAPWHWPGTSSELNSSSSSFSI